MNTSLHVDCRSAAGADSDALPLVCLHGWGMNLRVFDDLRDALPECESWAIDLPGHGRSEWQPARAGFDAQVEDVLAVLPPRCTLLGWSLGGKVALELARRAPQRVQSLVLVSATPRFAKGADWQHGLDASEREAFQQLLGQDWRQTLSDFVWLQLRGSRNAEATQQRVEAALNGHGVPVPDALRADLELLGTVDLRDRIAGIAQPALLVAGQNDRVVPSGATRSLAESLPQGRFHLIPRAAHAPFISHVAEFSALLRAFQAAAPADTEAAAN